MGLPGEKHSAHLRLDEVITMGEGSLRCASRLTTHCAYYVFFSARNGVVRYVESASCHAPAHDPRDVSN